MTLLRAPRTGALHPASRSTLAGALPMAIENVLWRGRVTVENGENPDQKKIERLELVRMGSERSG